MADNLLGPLVGHWLKKIQLAWEFKKKEFQDDADECMRFFDGPYEFMYNLRYAQRSKSFAFTSPDDAQMPRPTFSMTVNKAAEMVQLFGPVLYHRNPVRQVNPREIPLMPPELFGSVQQDPFAAQMFMQMDMQVQQARSMDQARAILLDAYLNYTPTALDLKTESRMNVDEALIKGMGTLWTETYTPKGSGFKLVGSFYDSVDNLLIDSDVEDRRQATWIARRCAHPVWEVERDYGLPPGSLKGHFESQHQTAGVDNSPEGDYHRKTGRTNDVCVYWKIFSKMGLGGRLQGINESYREPLETYGDYCYLVIAKGCPYPLNLPPDMVATADDMMISEAIKWPTPFWADDAWPFTATVFHERPRKLWPMSHLKPGLGELQFINWVYSFVASKLRTTSRDFLAMKKSLGEEIKTAVLSGRDYELLEIDENHGTITEAIQFLQHPEFNGDIWKVLEAVERNFEKRVGLTELMYAESPFQMRSAEEARVKAGQLQVRPDDMANKIEDSMSELARKEAFAARWHLSPQDVLPVLGATGAYWWNQLVVPADVSAILHQLEYRIEAGSTKKPNKDRDAANMQSAIKNLFQPLWQYAMQSGNVGPVNALIADWAKSIDLDAGSYLIQPPPMPMMPPAAPPEGGGPPA